MAEKILLNWPLLQIKFFLVPDADPAAEILTFFIKTVQSWKMA